MRARLRRFAVTTATLVCLALGSVPAHADGVAPAAASPLEREQAQTLFLRGKASFEQKAFREALESFRASLAVVNSPNTRLYVGRCLRDSGDPLGAYVEFGRTATEAREAAATDGRYKLTADEAVAERDGVQPELGFVTIRLNGADAATHLRVSGHPVRSPSSSPSSEPWPVMPGAVEVLVERDGVTVARRTVNVARGGRESIQVDVPPPPPASVATGPRESHDGGRTLRTLSFVAGGVGVAGFATFAIFGAMAKSTYDDLNTRCGGTHCAGGMSGVSDDISHGSTKQTVANVGLVVGAVGVVTGITLFAIGQSKRQVMLVPTGNGVALRGGL